MLLSLLIKSGVMHINFMENYACLQLVMGKGEIYLMAKIQYLILFIIITQYILKNARGCVGLTMEMRTVSSNAYMQQEAKMS